MGRDVNMDIYANDNIIRDIWRNNQDTLVELLKDGTLKWNGDVLDFNSSSTHGKLLNHSTQLFDKIENIIASYMNLRIFNIVCDTERRFTPCVCYIVETLDGRVMMGIDGIVFEDLPKRILKLEKRNGLVLAYYSVDLRDVSAADVANMHALDMDNPCTMDIDDSYSCDVCSFLDRETEEPPVNWRCLLCNYDVCADPECHAGIVKYNFSDPAANNSVINNGKHRHAMLYVENGFPIYTSTKISMEDCKSAIIIEGIFVDLGGDSEYECDSCDSCDSG